VHEQANGDEDGVNKYAEAIEIASFAETARLLKTASAFASSETSVLQRSYQMRRYATDNLISTIHVILGMRLCYSSSS